MLVNCDYALISIYGIYLLLRKPAMNGVYTLRKILS